MKIKEWSDNNLWNPFNSAKVFAQLYRWELIEQHKPLPQPPLITVDPTNLCDLNCKWCNSEFIIKQNPRMLDKSFMLELADFLPTWKGSLDWKSGVEAVCIAGGGEPLLNPNVGSFITRLVSNNIKVGVVTNGTKIHNFYNELSHCEWVGISVDAGNSSSFATLKGKNLFSRVARNIQGLNNYIAQNNCTLGRVDPGHGVTYKYLLTPENLGEVVQAATLAKEWGCKAFHLRPVGSKWNDLANNCQLDSFPQNIEDRLELIFNRIRELEDDTFKVYGITHKFSSGLEENNYFKQCYGIMMSCVIMPARNKGRYRLGLCCDRRGDINVELGEDLTNVQDISELWGSDEHWRLREEINPRSCPRCTLLPHNLAFEKVILQDSMTYSFF